ncbi:MAG: family 43 glycosylhydrolase, partial [bacterium]
GTKFYKRDGKYYIFSPAGGVATGWQTVLRANSPFGPFEERIVMAWADGTVNGPHQGAWVQTPEGKDCFLHFQDKGAYGRIVHLQPMTWQADGWPVIGEDPDGDGVGQPVKDSFAPLGMTESCHPEEAEGRGRDLYLPYGIGLEWQYPAVPSPYWHYALPEGGVRLYSVEQKWPYNSLWDCPNFLSQKFPAERFTVRARLSFRPNPQLKERSEQAGFAVMGSDYAGLRLTDTEEGARLEYIVCQGADKGGTETAKALAVLPYRYEALPHDRESKNVPQVSYPDVPEVIVWVELDVRARAVEGNVPDAVCRFRYSLDGKRFTQVDGTFIAQPGRWTGAKFGFWCNRFSAKNDSGWLDVTDLTVKPAFDPLEGFLYDEDKVPSYTLPDLLAGTKTKKEWEQKRRPELIGLFEKEMYGSVPGKPEGLHFRVRDDDPVALGGLATRRQVRIYFDAAESQYEDLLVYIPNNRKDAVPAFLGVNFFGNHTIDTDPGIFLPDSLRYRKDFTVDPRGSQAQRWPLKEILGRGYAVATFCCEDVV